MPERKSPPARKSAAGKTGAAKSTGKPSGTGLPRSTAAKSAPARASAPKSASAAPLGKSGGSGGRPPNRKPGKSIVNQRQTPWGLIITTAAIVIFAVAIVAVVVATHKSTKKTAAAAQKTSNTNGGQSVSANDPYRRAELPAAKAIAGLTYRVEGEHTHVDGVIKYDSSPPVGGNHDQLWADCNGNVYTHQLANENAVHMLEHGAVWITYNPKKLSAAGVAKLATYVKGQDRIAMSPYAGLKTPFSMQSWGYQLFLTSPTDPRIAKFITLLKYNPKTTPENALCTNPYFKASKSTFGHPQELG